MSELTDLAIRLAGLYGWEMLIFGFLMYQFYWPSWLHPTRTKVQSALAKFHVVGIILEAVAQDMENLDEDMVREVFQSNGYEPEDFKNTGRKAAD